MSNPIMVIVEVWTDNKFVSKHEFKYGEVELQRFFYSQIASKNQVIVYDATVDSLGDKITNQQKQIERLKTVLDAKKD